MSFHIPNDGNYGDTTQPKFRFASSGADTLMTITAETGAVYIKGSVGIGTSSPTGWGKSLSLSNTLEDKIVKYFFKSLSENKSVSRHMPKTEEKLNLFRSFIKKPIVPSDKEIRENPPSRSAKLRYVIKKEDFFDFETDILDKFKHLIDIENLSKKL